MLYDYLLQQLAATNDFPALRRCIADVRRMLEKGGPYHNCFKKVIFSILDDHSTFRPSNPNGSFEQFRKAFEDMIKGIKII